MAFSPRCKLGAAAVVGIVLCTIGTIFEILWPSMFYGNLDEQMVLANNSKSFDMWEVTPIPMYMEFHLFNWENPDDLYNKSSKPILKEMGPYVFREHRIKVIQGWYPQNDSVSYFQNHTWTFEPTLSNGTLDDLVTTVNVPALTAAYSLRHSKSSIGKYFLNKAFEILKIKIHVTKTVREFLFEGYDDPLLNLTKFIPAKYLPPIPFDKFGWFYTRNGSATYDGLYSIFTGKHDINKLGDMGQWNGANHTKYYQSYCAQVNGSAGDLFPPKQGQTSISLFVPDLCRTLTLNYHEESSVNGISGYRYMTPANLFDNATSNKANWCFCAKDEECPPNGALDISSCKFGAPAFISFPHFYNADPSYREAVVGMKPDPSKHQMFIDLEPNSGIPMQAHAAFQINILMSPMNAYNILENVPKIYFPCVWFKQTAQIDDKIGPEVKLLSWLPFIGSAVCYSIISIGVTILILAAICLNHVKQREDEDSVPLIVDVDT